ncbi:MAG: fused signal recognition particle receptor [Ignavibacteria bacterium]|nr:MAG: fused signal recognition particle receptor [Ignavibacteria bacterium]KAF0162082.1 MAG: fused signal recognition particle receptor [Ignavibacteria bacterium]
MGIFKTTIFQSVKQAFTKTKDQITDKLSEVFSKKTIEPGDLEQIENILLQSDFGIEFTEKLLEILKKKIRNGEEITLQNLKEITQQIFISEYNSLIKDSQLTHSSPHFIILLGINGSGKTTTIAKLANYYSNLNKSVVIGSCDTFRAAANEQLNIWAKRTNVQIIEDFSKDPAAVAYETCNVALNNSIDVVLLDTAGRLHTNKNLLDELKKILNAVKKVAKEKSIEIFLVVDGNSGQNAKNQLNEFSKVVNVTGLIITKLDGTAKGGSVLQLCLANKVPIKFLGIGEQVNDFVEFDPKDYIKSIFE